MKERYLVLSALVIILMLAGCATIPTSKMQTVYPKMYSVKPVSIMVLPPINKSTATEAKEYFSCSLAEPIALKGYYPVPVEAMYTILKQEGLYDTEEMNPVVLANFRKFFGCDAVLLTTIEKWDKSYGTLTIKAKYELLNTTNGESLWDFHSVIVVSLTSSSSNLLVNIIETSIKTAVEDYFPNAYVSNRVVFNNYLPSGKYSPNYAQDGETIIPASKNATLRISK